MRTATDLVSMRLAVCYVLADCEQANGMDVTRAIEDFAGEHIDKARVYRTLYDLRAEGLVKQEKENQTRGSFQLTDDGSAMLNRHHDWFCDRIADYSGE